MTNADQEYLPLLMVTQDQADFVKGVRSPGAVYIKLDKRPEMASDPACHQGHPDYRTIPIPEGIDVAITYSCPHCEGSGHCVDYDSDDGSTLVEVPCVGECHKGVIPVAVANFASIKRETLRRSNPQWTVVDDYWYVTLTDVKLVEKP